MAKQKNKIKLIAFDVGGVLQLGTYDDSKQWKHHTMGVHKYIARKLKIKLDTWFDSIDTDYAKAIEGKISREKVISIISKRLKVSKVKLIALLHKAYARAFKKNRELYKIAKKLKKQGEMVGILSDQWYFSEDVLMGRRDMKGFNPIICSCDVGMRKPNPKIYKMLIKKARVKPNEILFIDNRDWNMPPAKKLGIKTILFKDNKQCIRELKKMGVLK